MATTVDVDWSVGAERGVTATPDEDWSVGAERVVATTMDVDWSVGAEHGLATTLDDDGVVTSPTVLTASDGKGGGSGKSALVHCTRAFFFCCLA